MIVLSEAHTTYIFGKSMQHWFMIRAPERFIHDYERPYTQYSKALAPTNLGFWSEE